MITYFSLRRPEAEVLMGVSESYGNREYRPCPITDEHLDYSRRADPLRVRVNHDRRDEKMIWGWEFGTVIHEELLAEMEQQGFTGYRSQPATVTFSDGTISASYRELMVTGWAGIASPHSGVQVAKSCPACHWKKYTAVTNYDRLIDWTQWTGEDFFFVWPMPHWTLVTERVAEWLLRRGVQSFHLTSLDDYDDPVGGSGFTVGRLSDYLPDDLAIRYGQPLDLV